ncbi:hypothetical protein vBYenSP400_83 [Yersinia phage vB_YenS_P400]|nr:hypothetical protein vBYenSP400_83 [Yersinia phage vB_YenS_P400]
MEMNMENKEKLIDILLRDGNEWPKDAKVILLNLLGHVEVKYSMPNALFGKDDVNYVTKELFMKAREQQMNNEKWMPKVGEVCEFRHKGWAIISWSTAEVAAMTDEYLIVRYEYSNSEQHYNLADIEFRPLKSPKGLATEAMKKEWRKVAGDSIGGDLISIYDAIYDAIADGKVPGVVLEKKKRNILVSIDGLFGHENREESVAYRVFLNDKCIIADAMFGRSESTYCKKYDSDLCSGELKVFIDEASTPVEITAEWVD